MTRHSRAEVREAHQRPLNKTYYYIDFRQSIDAIKFRVHQVTKEAQKALGDSGEKKDWICPRCKSQYTELEVLDNVVADGFACHNCGETLGRIEESGIRTGGQQKVSRLMNQLDGIIRLLQKIDEVFVPDNNFEVALSNAVVVTKDNLSNPQQAPSLPEPAVRGGVKGTTIIAPKVEVSFTGDGEASEADSTAARQRAALAAQNALPVWHTTSTVTGDLTTLGKQEAARDRELNNTAALLKKEEEDKRTAASTTEEDSIADYYAEMAREKALEEAREREAEEDSSDDEEDEDEDDGFEDVGLSGSTTHNGGSLNNLGIRDGSESLTSRTTGTPLPADGEEPLAKKVRIEAPMDVDADSDEDDEFEDVV
jgi:transcription initiation factor TFIIE subunit alpha